MVLSSAAMVTAAETVQADEFVTTQKENNMTTKGTKDHEGLRPFVSLLRCEFVSLVVTRFKLLATFRLQFGRKAGGDLYLRFALTLSKESGASYFAQAYIPTQPAQAIEGTRISHAHEDPGRQESNFPPSRQGAQAGLGETRFPRIVPWRGENAAPIALLCQTSCDSASCDTQCCAQ